MQKDDNIKTDIIEAENAYIKNIVSTGTITFYDENGKPVTTTISDIINRIYKAISSKQNK